MNKKVKKMSRLEKLTYAWGATQTPMLLTKPLTIAFNSYPIRSIFPPCKINFQVFKLKIQMI